MVAIFFFFQAEDGIRDVAVTGVQTCALPISKGGESIACRIPPERLGAGLVGSRTGAKTERWEKHMGMSGRPKTRYAKSGEVNIAYQVVGEGPRDLVFVPGWVSNIEVFWEEPSVVRFLERLASFARLILFDKRGTGLSDRVADMPALEVRMDDVRAVMDAVGSREAAVFGYSEGGQMCALFPPTHRVRTAALIMHGSYALLIAAPDCPWGRSPALM